MIQQKTRRISSPCWISSLSRTSTSGRADHTVTGTGRKVVKNTTLQINSKRSVVIREMDRLANEDHSHIATEEEIDVYRSNWWIRSNFVGSDTIPVKHRPDFKKALSILHRLKKAKEKLLSKLVAKLFVVAMANFLVASLT